MSETATATQVWRYSTFVMTGGVVRRAQEELRRPELEQQLATWGEAGWELAWVLMEQQLHGEKDGSRLHLQATRAEEALTGPRHRGPRLDSRRGATHEAGAGWVSRTPSRRTALAKGATGPSRTMPRSIWEKLTSALTSSSPALTTHYPCSSGFRVTRAGVNRFIVTSRLGWAPGTHTVKVIASDRVGNRGVATRSFRVR
jgi:hypothetical protein